MMHATNIRQLLQILLVTKQAKKKGKKWTKSRYTMKDPMFVGYVSRETEEGNLRG